VAARAGVPPVLDELDEDEEDEEEEEEELALPLLELDDDDDEDELDLPLLLELEELLVPPAVTFTDVTLGRPLPFPQNPKLAVPPFAAITVL